MSSDDLLARGRDVQRQLWGDRAGGHLVGALNLGVTREELIEVLMQTSQYAGIPAAVQALGAAAGVLLPREAKQK